MSGLVVVGTTLAGGVIGGWAGWLAGFMTAEWSMDCTYCDRPAKTAVTRRVGVERASVYSDPEKPPDKDRSHVEVVRYCGVEHRP
jgi:hypothetical protein